VIYFLLDRIIHVKKLGEKNLKNVKILGENGDKKRSFQCSQYQKGKTSLDFTVTVSGSGISWAICNSAHRSRQITMPAPHHSVFTGPMLFLLPNQQHQSTEGKKRPLNGCFHPQY